MLMTNLLTYVLLLVLLTLVPMLPGMIMSRFLSAGLADEHAGRPQANSGSRRGTR
jgi:hypothetical protein